VVKSPWRLVPRAVAVRSRVRHLTPDAGAAVAGQQA
jgi:hypothetical protein